MLSTECPPSNVPVIIGLVGFASPKSASYLKEHS